MDTMRPAALLSWERTWRTAPWCVGRRGSWRAAGDGRQPLVRSRLALVLVGVWAMR